MCCGGGIDALVGVEEYGVPGCEGVVAGGMAGEIFLSAGLVGGKDG